MTDTFSRLRPLLGTFVAVEVVVPQGWDPGAALEAGYAAVAEVDRLMHPTRAGSDLSRMAIAPMGAPTEAHAWTLQVLELARQLHRESDGAFDPCLPKSPARLADIELHGTRVICRAPALLDLGGIAKGFAVDQAVAALQRHGALSGLVNAGGDLRVFGPAARTVQLRAPDGQAVELELRDAALAVSAPRSADSPPGHLGYYHGASGAAVVGRAVAVSAPATAVADALCKCAMLCEPTLLGQLLDRHRARLILG